jgi:hypothetical protein
MFRKPDGVVTDDPDEYVAAWKALTDPWEREFGFQVIGFNPGALFAVDNRTLSVDTWWLRRVNQLIAERDRLLLDRDVEDSARSVRL